MGYRVFLLSKTDRGYISRYFYTPLGLIKSVCK